MDYGASANATDYYKVVIRNDKRKAANIIIGYRLSQKRGQFKHIFLLVLTCINHVNEFGLWGPFQRAKRKCKCQSVFFFFQRFVCDYIRFNSKYFLANSNKHITTELPFFNYLQKTDTAHFNVVYFLYLFSYNDCFTGVSA